MQFKEVKIKEKRRQGTQFAKRRYGFRRRKRENAEGDEELGSGDAVRGNPLSDIDTSHSEAQAHLHRTAKRMKQIDGWFSCRLFVEGSGCSRPGKSKCLI